MPQNISDRRVPPLPEEFNSSSEEQTISLHNILKVFEDGLKEEQTWAVAYKTVKEFKLNTTTDVVNNPKKTQLRCAQTYDDLLITASGRAIIKETCKPAEDAQQAIQCLANTLHTSLDFGLGEDQERELSSSLENLILNMIDDESDSDASSDCLNAGAKDNHGICEFEKTLSLCRSHLGRPDQADQHYTAVCRALYATASELHRFLNKISSANTQLRKMSENNNLEDLPGRAHPDLFSELDMSTWASLWMQCVANLRSGVTLRQIETRHSPVPIQFELTPYEMLMQDIRSKNFSLKKTTDWVNGDLPLATRTNAHKIIMDFIRSRPSLKPTSKRRLKPKLPQPKSHHEKILDEIKKPSSRALLNPAETKLRVYQPFKLGTVLDSENSPKQNRNHSFSSPSKSKINSQLPRSNTIQPITRSRTKLGMQPTRSKTIQKVSDSASMSSNGSNPVKKKINVKALLHEDPSMDINEPLEKLNFSTPKRRSSERAVDVRDHKKVIQLDSWSSASSFKSSPSRSSPLSTSIADAQIYANPALVESCGENLGITYDSDLDDPLDPRASLGKFNRNDNLRKSDSKDTKMKQYFKRSYTVHGLSSAARKIRSSFGKGKATSKQQLDEVIMPPLNVPKKKSNKPNRRETQNEKSIDVSTSRKPEVLSMHSQWAHPIEGLCLKLEEVKQIRSTVTMGDVEKFRHQKSLHNSLQKGKICFVCKIRKFGIFTWSYNCPLCMRNVCFRCLRKCTVSDDVSLMSDSNSDLSFLNLPAHALNIDMREIKEDVKNSNDIKVCLDCIDMLMHIKSSSKRTIEVAHHVQENLNQQKQKFEARLDKKKRR